MTDEAHCTRSILPGRLRGNGYPAPHAGRRRSHAQVPPAWRFKRYFRVGAATRQPTHHPNRGLVGAGCGTGQVDVRGCSAGAHHALYPTQQRQLPRRGDRAGWHGTLDGRLATQAGPAARRILPLQRRCIGRCQRELLIDVINKLNLARSKKPTVLDERMFLAHVEPIPARLLVEHQKLRRGNAALARPPVDLLTHDCLAWQSAPLLRGGGK